MAERRLIGWYSCGAASAVAVKLTGARPVYCETGAEHEDSARFLGDCEAWFGCAIERLRSARFSDTWDVWQRRRYLAGVDGALCTIELKVKPRLLFQRPDDIHVFGYTADAADIERAAWLRGSFPELEIRTPLIDRGLTKAACLEMVTLAGLRLPAMYGLGFHNNNCIPCVKATSPGYWALVRWRFPDKFARMATLSRSLGVRLCRIRGERAFIDEIPADWPMTDPIQPSCDFLCQIAAADL